MANKIRKITTQGHVVKGALAAHVGPKLAADGAFKPGELNEVLKSIPPKPYSQQIPLIADAMKAKFGSRLAKDLDIDDLPDILEALKNSDDFSEDENPDADVDTPEVKKKEEALPIKDEDKDDPSKMPAKDEDESVASDEDDAGTKLMAMLGKYEIPAEDLEQINELINALSQGTGGEMKPAIDELPEEKDKKKEEAPITKAAMDRALAAHDSANRERVKALFTAAADVAPFIGQVDTLAFDSANDIYRLALDHAGVNIKGVHPSAYKAMLSLAMQRPAAQPVVAADAASHEDFNKRYTHIPVQA